MGQTTDGGAGGGRKHTTFQSRLNFNFWSAAGFILFAVLILLLIPTQIEKPFVILGQAQSVLSPVLFPQLTIAILLIVSIWYLVASFWLEEKNLLKEVGGEGFLSVAVTVGLLVAYALLMEALGFMLSSALMVGILTVYYGTRNILMILVASVAVPVAIYYVFTRTLLVFLPEFSLFEIGPF